jgi:hypothetical protein
MYNFSYIGNHDFEEIVKRIKIKSIATRYKAKGDYQRKG